MSTTVKLYSLPLTNVKTFLLALLFIVGNILFPQLAHLLPQGGLIFLPIYFFTLVGAYKYGIHVGLLTAVLSPLVNHLLFGMPPRQSCRPSWSSRLSWPSRLPGSPNALSVSPCWPSCWPSSRTR